MHTDPSNPCAFSAHVQICDRRIAKANFAGEKRRLPTFPVRFQRTRSNTRPSYDEARRAPGAKANDDYLCVPCAFSAHVQICDRRITVLPGLPKPVTRVRLPSVASSNARRKAGITFRRPTGVVSSFAFGELYHKFPCDPARSVVPERAPVHLSRQRQ